MSVFLFLQATAFELLDLIAASFDERSDQVEVSEDQCFHAGQKSGALLVVRHLLLVVHQARQQMALLLALARITIGKLA
jgi:hypothetical protein